MHTSNNTSSFDEDKKLTLIDTIEQLEALAASFTFKVKDSPNNPRMDFYIGTLFHNLLRDVRKLIDEICR
jgi:hypothetical protein